jgi:hypothetical protein
LIRNGSLLGSGELPAVKENTRMPETCNRAKFPITPDSEDDWDATDFISGLFDFQLDPETYETIVIVSSLGTGILLTMVCIIWVVYRSFRVSTSPQ